MSSQHSEADPHCHSCWRDQRDCRKRAAYSLDGALRDAPWARCLMGSSTTVAALRNTSGRRARPPQLTVPAD